MASNATFAEVAALAGDPARAGMLHALMDGRALTASELARVAGITPQTASTHLARLCVAGLLEVEKQGRHRYHRLASPAVAQMMESIMLVASRTEPSKAKLTIGPRDAALRAARTCYDHLAGRLGVSLADAMVAKGQVELAKDGGLMTETGMELLAKLGIDVDPMVARSSRGGRVLCRPCLDWSERRPHLAGAVGAALCTRSFDQGWIRRIEGTRAVAITPKGQRSYRELFSIAPS
jgi:DNA-binding transcriptional ArsR family regulator